MTSELLEIAQHYLTVDDRKLLDIEDLLVGHTIKDVADFLETLMREKKDTLKDLIILDKTTSMLDRAVADCFRLHMALSHIKRLRGNDYERS